MAYRYRRSRYGRRHYYRRRKFGGGNRFTRKLRRSLNQKDTCRIILSSKPETLIRQYVGKTQGATINYDGLYTRVFTFNPMYKLMGAIDSEGQTIEGWPPLPGFARFRDLFDQFKVNAVRMRIQIVSQPIGTSNAAGLLRTAIDRNGIAPQFNTLLTAQKDDESDTIMQANKVFESYSSFQQKIVNNSDLYSIYRTFYPVGREKGNWFGASHQYVEPSSTTVDLSNFNYPFKPILFLQFYVSNIGSQVIPNVQFNIVYEYDITFKGQRNITE